MNAKPLQNLHQLLNNNNFKGVGKTTPFLFKIKIMALKKLTINGKKVWIEEKQTEPEKNEAIEQTFEEVRKEEIKEEKKTKKKK